MDKKLRELRQGLTKKVEEAKLFVEQGKIEEARNLTGEAEMLKEQIENLEKLQELEKDVIDSENTEVIPTETKPEARSVLVKALRGKKLDTEERAILKEGKATSPDVSGAYIVPEDVRTEINEYKRQYKSMKEYIDVQPTTTISGSFIYEKSGTLSELVDLTEGEEIAEQLPDFEKKEYTISLKVKKGTGTSKIKIIQSNKEEIILDAGINDQINWVSFSKTFKTTATVITLSIENTNSYLQVADIMLVDGGYPKVWTASQGEIYTPNTKIDGNGIKIANKSNSNVFVAMSDKTGVYKGTQKIFDVENETVTMKNIVVSDVVGSILQVGKVQQIIRNDGVDFVYID